LSKEEIKKAYNKKAMEYHPDRNHAFKNEAEEKMKEINSSFDYLKKKYDNYIRLSNNNDNKNYQYDEI
jgi:DnaJ-class molecular chaperone